MNLYEVTNGFTGFSYVRCLVITSSKKQAVELARPKFKADAYSDTKSTYWERLEATIIFKGLNREHIGEVTDE